jgi:uncharacterized damage-inducible protein DinB
MPNIRPAADEYAPYYGTYIAQVPDGDVVATLAEQVDDTLDALRGLTEEQALFRYAPGKWSVKEVLTHMIDAERVFMYRALTFGRGATDSLPPFDEDAWAPAAEADAVPLEELLDEFAAVRASTVAMLAHFPRDAWRRRGIASGKGVTVRALAWMTAGHERHHLRVLRERYLAPV